MLKFSANLGLLWRGLPLIERIEAAARAGFRAIEMHWPYETPAQEVGAVCRRLGVAILGINTAPGDLAKGDLGLAAVPGREREFRESMAQAMEYAAASGAAAIHVMAGVVDAAHRVRGRHVLLENLRASADAAARHGLTLLLEPINPRSAPGYFYSRVEEAASVIGELALTNVKLQFDVFHVAIAEGDVLTKPAAHMPIIGNVQIAAVPSRAEPDEGEIHYPAIFSALERLGYQGWVGCEYVPRGKVEEGLKWMKAMGVATTGA
jgi:hydroxypyruvate isomerase